MRNYGKSTSSQTLKGLLVTIEKSRQRYNQAQIEVSSSQTSALTPEVLTTFLNLDDNNWQTTDKTLKITLNRILLQGLPPGIPDYLLQEIIKNQLESTPAVVPQQAITDLLINILANKHNLTVDKEATKQRAEQAAQAVETVIVEISRGCHCGSRGQNYSRGVRSLRQFSTQSQGVKLGWVRVFCHFCYGKCHHLLLC